MSRMNYNHLYYFWVVARTGSVTAAAKELHTSQPTISTQVRQLEEQLNQPLFVRTGRNMRLTEAGKIAMRHADEMFRLGQTMLTALDTGGGASSQRLEIGAADAVPKLIVRAVIQPALKLFPDLCVSVREWRVDTMFNELSMHRLDMVICDTPLDHEVQRETVSTPVAESPVMLCAAPELARTLKKNFPHSLENAPLVLPPEQVQLRKNIDRWLLTRGVRPRVAVEAEDRALAHHFGQIGVGAVPVAGLVEEEVCRQFQMVRVAPLDTVREQYFAVVVERALKHPAVHAICAAGGVAAGNSGGLKGT